MVGSIGHSFFQAGVRASCQPHFFVQPEWAEAKAFDSAAGRVSESLS
jgi:hypothetical protein